MVYLNTIYKILLTLSKAIVNDIDIEMAGPDRIRTAGS
jgi:hypothetical protein